MSYKRKQDWKKIGAIALVCIIGFAAIMAMTFDAGRQYEKHLDESLGVNRQTEGSTLTGHIYVYVMRGDSQVWSLAHSEGNLITNVGRNATRDYLGGTAGASFDYIGVGTGTGGGAGSEALVTPFSTRQQGTYDDTAVAYNFTITTTFAAGFFSDTTITESAVFNASSSGIMLNYQSFSGIVLSAADSLQVIFEFMISDAG